MWRIATKPLFHRNYSTVQKNCGKDAASDRPSLMGGSASGMRCSCGSRIRAKQVNGRWYWCCCRHDEKGDCAIKPVPEAQTDKAFRRLYYKLKHQSLPILERMLETLQTIRDHRLLWSEDIVSLNKKISELSSQNQTLAFLKQNGLVDPDIFISKSNELTRQLRQAKLDKEKLMDAEGDTTAHRTRELIALLEDGPGLPRLPRHRAVRRARCGNHRGEQRHPPLPPA